MEGGALSRDYYTYATHFCEAKTVTLPLISTATTPPGDMSPPPLRIQNTSPG